MADSIFRSCREGVSVPQACARYGVELNRCNKALCPFHSEKTPSFSVRKDGRYWYCFGCGEGGDVITFAQKLFHLSPYEAARQLDADFGLGYSGKPPPRRELLRRKEEQRKKRIWKQWAEGTYDMLCDWRRRLFYGGEDTSAADAMLDLLTESPVLFYNTYRGRVLNYRLYDEAWLDYPLADYEDMIFPGLVFREGKEFD